MLRPPPRLRLCSAHKTRSAPVRRFRRGPLGSRGPVGGQRRDEHEARRCVVGSLERLEQVLGRHRIAAKKVLVGDALGCAGGMQDKSGPHFAHHLGESIDVGVVDLIASVVGRRRTGPPKRHDIVGRKRLDQASPDKSARPGDDHRAWQGTRHEPESQPPPTQESRENAFMGSAREAPESPTPGPPPADPRKSDNPRPTIP